ncbi:hypothetical protein F4810DRAFT_518882 [Camillea tinctor]|nr:hypothetical protein F4810DRAFT_518882 [Camillea tinctor]
MELDSSPAEFSKVDDRLALSRSSPSSSSEAPDTEPISTKSPVEETGDHLQEKNDSSIPASQTDEDLDPKIPTQSSNYISDSKETEDEDDTGLPTQNHKDENHEVEIHTHSDRSQNLQDGVDASVPNERLPGIDQMEQSSNPVLLAEENEPTTALQPLPTSPTAIGEPENRTSVGSDRNGTSESVAWGLESRSHTASHVTGDEDGHSVATNASHDDHESKGDQKSSAATLLERHTSPAQQDPNPDGIISIDDLPQENEYSSPSDQHLTPAADSAIIHNALSDTHNLHIDAEGIKLDEKPEVAGPAEENHANSHGSNKPASDLHRGATHSGSELDPNDLESPSGVGKITTPSTNEHIDESVKEVNVHSHSHESQEEETSHVMHVDDDAIIADDNDKKTVNDHEEDIEDWEDVNVMAKSLDEEPDVPGSESRGLESTNNDIKNDDKQKSPLDLDLRTPLSSPQPKNSLQPADSNPNSPYAESHLVITADGGHHIHQDVVQDSIHPTDASISVKSHDPTALREAANISSSEKDQDILRSLPAGEPSPEEAYSPLPVETDTMHGHEDLFDDDAISFHSYENEDLDRENINGQVFGQSTEYALNEVPDTPRAAVPNFGGQHLSEELHSPIGLQETEEKLPSPRENEGHREALEIQEEAEPMTPTVSTTQARPGQDVINHELDNSLSAPQGLAASRHSPESQHQTSLHSHSQQDEEDLDPELFMPRDVTNLPWHARNDSMPQSMHSESTLDSPPSSPVHSAPSNQYHEPVIRESWSTHTGSTGRMRNDSQLTDQSASDEFDSFRYDTGKPMPPNNIDLDSQRQETPTIDNQRLSSSNRNSLGGSPMFQKIRNLFEAPNNAAGSEQSSSSSLGNSRPTSAIFTGAAVKPQDLSPKPAEGGSVIDHQPGQYVNEDEDDRIGEHTALLSDPGMRAGVN